MPVVVFIFQYFPEPPLPDTAYRPVSLGAADADGTTSRAKIAAAMSDKPIKIACGVFIVAS